MIKILIYLINCFILFKLIAANTDKNVIYLNEIDNVFEGTVIMNKSFCIIKNEQTELPHLSFENIWKTSYVIIFINKI